jgi:hypothetical protein
MAGSASTLRPAVLDSTRTRNERLHAVQDEATVGLDRLRRRLEDVEEDGGLGEGEGRSRNLGTGEGGEVGLLLLVGAPQGQRGRDGAGRQGRDGHAHVALGKCLGDQGAGDG